MSVDWKELILSSGLPLEYEVKAYLEEKGLVPSHDFAYLRDDESGRPRAESYDVRATMLLPWHQLELMFECEYRHPSANWFFLPEQYGGIYELNPLDVYHPIEQFTKQISPLANSQYYYPPLAPVVGKGVEVSDKGTSTEYIRQAASKLALSFAEQIVEAVVTEVDMLLVKDIVLCHVPVIVTTANLFRLRDGVTMLEVRNASAPEQIADRMDMLVMKQPEDPDIYGRNLDALSRLAMERRDDLKKRMNWHNDDLDHLLEVLSKQPRAYVVVQFTDDRSSLDRFLRYTADCFDPKSEFRQEVRRRSKEAEARIEEFRKKVKGPHPKAAT